jgi:hypothetical protein
VKLPLLWAIASPAASQRVHEIAKSEITNFFMVIFLLRIFRFGIEPAPGRLGSVRSAIKLPDSHWPSQSQPGFATIITLENFSPGFRRRD